MKRPLALEWKYVASSRRIAGKWEHFRQRTLSVVGSEGQWFCVLKQTCLAEAWDPLEYWSGDREICIATIRLWQKRGWLGPLPKRVPKAFRDALEGVR